MKTRPVSLALSYTLCALAAAAAALAPLPRGVWAIPALGGAAGALLDRRGTRRLPKALLTGAGLAGFLASLLPLRRETLAEQFLTALACLLAVKMLGVKSRRDHLQILAVSLAVTAGAAMLEPALAFGALLAFAALLGILTLMWLPFAETAAEVDAALVRRLAAVGLGLAAAAAPIALLLFVLLPRSMNPYWATPGGRAARAVSGISDRLQLGDVGRIAIKDDVAFRAEVEGGRPLPQTPYWRGAVLELTDGRRWEVSARTRPAAQFPRGAGTRITYYVEPHGSRQLFLLEAPTGAAVGAVTQPLGAARVLRLPLPLARRIRYVGSSIPAGRFAERLTPEERSLNLKLPPELPESIPSLATGIAAGAHDPAAVADRFLAHFSRGHTYSLQVPADAGDPLEGFLVRHRTGYCEYFASGLAVMLRAVGIPARVVSGYLGGEFVEAGGYYLVTQAAAHAWVEAYLGDSWVRLDPTPPVDDPGRTFATRRAGKPQLWLDALRMRWNSWIVQFDAESQLALARSGAVRAAGLRADFAGAARAAACALGIAALIGAAIAAARRRSAEPLAARIAAYETLAARSGAAREPHEGPLDHAERFAGRAPGAAPQIRRFADSAAACRYGGRPADPRTLAELDALLAAIRARAASLAPPSPRS